MPASAPSNSKDAKRSNIRDIDAAQLRSENAALQARVADLMSRHLQLQQDALRDKDEIIASKDRIIAGLAAQLAAQHPSMTAVTPLVIGASLVAPFSAPHFRAGSSSSAAVPSSSQCHTQEQGTPPPAPQEIFADESATVNQLQSMVAELTAEVTALRQLLLLGKKVDPALVFNATTSRVPPGETAHSASDSASLRTASMMSLVSPGHTDAMMAALAAAAASVTHVDFAEAKPSCSGETGTFLPPSLPLCLGAVVRRGPDWSSPGDEDGFGLRPDALGDVVLVLPGSVMVQWRVTGKTYMYPSTPCGGATAVVCVGLPTAQ
jgi:hypothetical protein